MIPHEAFLDGIALPIEKCEGKHIEEPPVLRDGISLGIAPDKSRDPVLFRAAVALPD